MTFELLLTSVWIVVTGRGAFCCTAWGALAPFALTAVLIITPRRSLAAQPTKRKILHIVVHDCELYDLFFQLSGLY